MLSEIREQYAELDIKEFTSEHEYDDIRKKFPGEHIPPDGCLHIAKNDDKVCGCIAVGKLTDSICEIRTLFVRPDCRGMGVGKQLVEVALKEARSFGYRSARLDTLRFMHSALKLYRSFGFRDIEPYRALSDSLKQYICFLELNFSD
jgi:ribosomal protein S18 acetylase RimI-like enzyme